MPGTEKKLTMKPGFPGLERAFNKQDPAGKKVDVSCHFPFQIFQGCLEFCIELLLNFDEFLLKIKINF